MTDKPVASRRRRNRESRPSKRPGGVKVGRWGRVVIIRGGIQVKRREAVLSALGRTV